MNIQPNTLGIIHEGAPAGLPLLVLRHLPRVLLSTGEASHNPAQSRPDGSGAEAI